MKTIVKKAGKTTADEARQIAKQIGRELVEIPKQAGKQLAGVETLSGSSSKQPHPSDKSNSSTPIAEPEEKKKLDYLEKELEELKKKRKLLEQQKKLAEESEKKKKEAMPVSPSIQEPTTKPKRGLFAVKKKQGTREMGKRPSG
jgi:hypothetical protein